MKKHLLIMLIILPLFSACEGEKKELKIELPSTPVLSTRDSWGIISSTYARMRINPDFESEARMGLAKGTVIKILFESRIESTKDNVTAGWYNVSMDNVKGWVWGAYLEIYTSQEEAKEAAQRIK